MYGVPKFKESFLMRYKKEVLLSVGAFLAIATVVKFVPGQDILEVKPIEENRVIIEEVAPIIGYKMVINGTEIGVVASEDDLDSIVDKAYELLVIELGYDPDLITKPALIPIHEGELTLDSSEIVENLKVEMVNSLGVVKQKAFVMRIGDDFTIALESEDSIKEVLAKAQMQFINAEVQLEIDLEENEFNTMVMTPKVLMKNPDEQSINLSTAAQENEDDIIDEIKSDKVDEEQDIEIKEVDPGKMVSINFAEDIAIVETFVDPADIVDVVTATELITKENEEEKIYLVESGDCLSTIADHNDMKLADLYKMNPGIKGKETAINIGDSIVVMVPEPELKVETKVELVYTEPIDRETDYIDDDSAYVGSDSVVDDGSNGVLQVTTLLTKVNGEEIEREIIGTEILTKPKNKVIAKGRKPFPVKGATGSYVFPVSGYRISSPFGYRWGGFHRGVDLALGAGNSIHAADGGTIIFAGWRSSNYGYMVEIDHSNGVTTRYAHCSSVTVVVGQSVSKYETIAKVGSTGRSTGPHVHFELRFNGVATDPLNYLE